ncbi:MAG: radical SAM protein [Firmicutes bacterium]|nr:radical SAM protein [[Eubacterium] siraeum]MCM1488733.1 radical SAM protein [Bacillota bacterium]
MHFKEAKSILMPSGGINIYRGCTHGCIYCDSRSDCYQMDHDFEDVEVKINTPWLLEDALKRKKAVSMIGTGAMSDPYMHCEKELKLTRQCLEIIKKYGFGVSLQTKSTLILRDLDLICDIHRSLKAVVNMTVTTVDDDLCRILEPNVAVTSERFEALKIFRQQGIPTVVWLTPILPFINDTEENVTGIAEKCGELGVKGIITFGNMGVTMRSGDREYFYKCLDKHFPGMKERYAKRYGLAYQLPSPDNRQLMSAFKRICKKYGMMTDTKEIFDYMHSTDEAVGEQLSLL